MFNLGDGVTYKSGFEANLTHSISDIQKHGGETVYQVESSQKGHRFPVREEELEAYDAGSEDGAGLAESGEPTTSQGDAGTSDVADTAANEGSGELVSSSGNEQTASEAEPTDASTSPKRSRK